MGELKNRMLRKMELNNFSRKTIQIYLFHMKRFVAYYGKSPDLLGKEEIENYLHSIYLQKTSSSKIVQAYSAIKFFYSDLLERPWEIAKIPRAKTEKRLPIVLSLKEVKDILENIRNVKHQTILMTIYSAGLRLSEGLNLKIKNIDSGRMEIRIEQGKGKKDRYTLLSNTLLNKLRKYYRIYKPQYWLFPGRDGKPLCASTIQRAFHRAKKKPVLQNKQPYIHYAIASQPTF